jgi:hypothetical protein
MAQLHPPPASSKLIAPSTHAERAALDCFFRPAVQAARMAFDGMRRSGSVVRRMCYRGGILTPAGLAPEAAILLTLVADENVDFLEREERALAREMRDWLVTLGYQVGGIPCEARQVWIRGPRVAAVAAQQEAA